MGATSGKAKAAKAAKKGKQTKKGKQGKRGKSKRVKLPKLKCCQSRKACARCPIQMLKQATLPEGLSVRHRRVVSAALPSVPLTKKQLRALVRA